MTFDEFSIICEEKGFKSAVSLWSLANSLEIEPEELLEQVEEDYAPFYNCFEYTLGTETFYIMDEEQAIECVDNFRRNVIETAKSSISMEYHPYVDFSSMAEDYCNSIYDVFDFVDEDHVEINGIIHYYYFIRC